MLKMYRIFHCLVVAGLVWKGDAFLPSRKNCYRARRRESADFLPLTGPSQRLSLSRPTRPTTRLYGDLNAARRYVGDGMQAFRQGNIGESIDLFDKAEAEEPRLDPFLWQRGLSYYYADEFDKASQQFRRDVKVNPLDVEEIVWDIASQLRVNPTFPVPTALSLPRNQSDRRPIMAVVYKLFRGEANEHDLAEAGHASGKPSDEFYALLYLGLFAEARRDNTKAENYLRQAVHTEYATSLGRRDYMTDVARVSVFV